MPVSKEFSKSIHDLWGFFLIEGIAMLVLGVIAIALPPIFGLAVTVLLGWLLMASGLFGLIITIVSRQAPGSWWSLLSAIVTAGIGVVLILWPMGGVISLSLALAVFLVLDGLFAMAMAFDHRRHLTAKWAWLLINGVADLVFAAVILLWLPQSAAWALGLIVGIDMLIGGATLVAMALDVRQSA